MPKSKLEIIEETANAYTFHTRSLASQALRDRGYPNCLYDGGDGKRCAFARCCKDDPDTLSALRKADFKNTSIHLLMGHLKPEYQGHETEFWVEIQSFHDTDLFWNKNGLSRDGEEQKKYLLEGYAQTL